jgi:hypothetical protein
MVLDDDDDDDDDELFPIKNQPMTPIILRLSYVR